MSCSGRNSGGQPAHKAKMDLEEALFWVFFVVMASVVTCCVELGGDLLKNGLGPDNDPNINTSGTDRDRAPRDPVTAKKRL